MHFNEIPCTPKEEHLRSKQKRNNCTKHLKKMLSELYTREELANGAYTAGVKKYKNSQISSDALSPNRLMKILSVSKRKYPGKFESLNIPQVVNEKCRKTRLIVKSIN